MTKDVEKAKEISDFSAPSFTVLINVQVSQATEGQTEVWSKQQMMQQVVMAIFRGTLTS